MNFKVWLLSEMLGDADYKLPKDKEKQLYDFYMLTMLLGNNKPKAGEFSNQDKIDYKVDEISNILLPELKKNLLDAVFFSIASETRYVLDGSTVKGLIFALQDENIDDKQIEGFEKYLDQVGNLNRSQKFLKIKNNELDAEPVSDRKYSYSAALESGLSEYEFTKIAKILFELPIWGQAYGGKVWANICNGWLKLYESKDNYNTMIWIDHVYDLAHNTDTVFDKLVSYIKEGSYNWLAKALDHKLNIKDPHEIIDKVSLTMKAIALRAIKARTGKSYEQFIKEKDELTNNARIKNAVGQSIKSLMKQGKDPRNVPYARIVKMVNLLLQTNYSSEQTNYSEQELFDYIKDEIMRVKDSIIPQMGCIQELNNLHSALEGGFSLVIARILLNPPKCMLDAIKSNSSDVIDLDLNEDNTTFNHRLMVLEKIMDISITDGERKSIFVKAERESKKIATLLQLSTSTNIQDQLKKFDDIAIYLTPQTQNTLYDYIEKHNYNEAIKYFVSKTNYIPYTAELYIRLLVLRRQYSYDHINQKYNPAK